MWQLRPGKHHLEVDIELGLDGFWCWQHVGEIGYARRWPWESNFGSFNPFLAGRVQEVG